MAEIGRAFTITEAAARELVSALDALDQLARPRGQRLSASLADIRRELATCTSRPPVSGSTNAEGIAALLNSQSTPMGIDTDTAAEHLGITPDAVRWLCRNGRLIADRVRGRWFVEAQSLDNYRAHRAQR